MVEPEWCQPYKPVWSASHFHIISIQSLLAPLSIVDGHWVHHYTVAIVPEEVGLGKSMGYG